MTHRLLSARRLGMLAIGLVLSLSGLAAAPAAGTVALAATSAQPNRFDPTSRAASVHPAPAAKPPPATGQPAIRGGQRRPGPSLAPPATMALDPSRPARLVTASSALELVVPVGAVSAGDVAAAGGALTLLVRQVVPASGGSAGGSGHATSGTYLVQVLDAGGHLPRQGLRLPLGVTLHYGKQGAAFDAAHAVAVLNAPLPPWVALDPAAPAPLPARGAGSSAGRPAARLGPMSRRTPVVDARSQTLSTSAPLGGNGVSVGFDAQVPVATFGAPDVAEVSYNAGALTLQQPLDLPAGPGGLTPPLVLGYDSATVSDQHNVQAPAPWVGEGWHLSLGAISWAERDLQMGCGTVCETPQWSSTWQLVDAFGTRAELIPPALNVSTYYDDHNGTAITPSPVTWRTAPETYARVISFTGPNALPGQAVNPPCFRAFLPNGIMEEFGCTADSLQFYPQASGPNAGRDYVANWLPDLITDPRGNQVHVTYQTDVAAGFNGIAYPRDAVLATVEYDSPGCHNAQTACTGAAWAPLMRVSFQASHAVAHAAGSSCPANGSLRCDDPVDLTAGGGEAAPTVESTFLLNDALVQVRSGAAAAWNTVRDYQLAYDQSGPGTITDPFGGAAESTAGRLDLTRLTVIGADGSTALPSRSFGYGRQTQLYEDSVWAPAPATNCGYSWNVGPPGQGCNLWSQSYEGNSYYLTSVSSGLGLSQTFVWQNARNNSWGVPSGANLVDPFACNSQQSTSPCDVTDDGSWSRIVLTQSSESVVRLSQAGQGGAQSSTPVTGTTTYGYHMAPNDSYWGDSFDWDVLDFYNWRFMGFDAVTVSKPDGSSEIHRYPGTLGRGVYDPNDPMTGGQCTSTTPCNTSPWWNPANATHGREIELDSYNPDGSLVQVVKTQYQALCPPTGVGADKGGNLVSELDPLNPVSVCYVAPARVDRTLVNAGSPSTAPDAATTYVADADGRITSTTTTSSDGAATGTPATVVRRAAYTENESVSATATSATGTFLVDFPAFQDVEDAAGNRFQCTYASYDGHANVTGQTAGLTMGELTRSDTYTTCATAANGFTPSGQVSTAFAYDASGNPAAADDADALAGNPAHLGCAVGATTFSLCTSHDGTFGTLPTANANALGQRSSVGYQSPAAGTAAGGFGLWPTSTTDANGQTTSIAYDALGRQIGSTLPGETAGLTTTATAYTVWCSGTAAQSPCVEVDRVQRLNAAQTVTARAFYDGLGHLVETRMPAPGGQDVVRYSFYDASERLAFQSQPYFVAAYTGGPGAAAYSIPDSTQPGTTTTYDGMGRTTSVTDALSHRIATAYTTVCAPAGTGDAACYEQALTVDGAGHQAGTLIAATGQTAYEQRYTGASSSTYTLYATTRYTYDFVGHLVGVLQPDGATRTGVQYDMAGRETGLTDPDLGARSFAYDAAGNLVQSVDPRGAAGTVFTGYDGLNRPVWRNTANTPAGAYATFSYDSTAGGSAGVGHLTGETFANGSLSGSTAFAYDVRGRASGTTLTVGGSSYPVQGTYDDAGNVLTRTYPDGEVVSNGYTAQGWLSSVGTQRGGTTTTLLAGATYAGTAGAFGDVTGASQGSLQYSASTDLLGRPTDSRLTSGGTTLFDQALTYDGAGNVAAASTTLPAGTDHQAFCYDEQNRLTWAGSTGTAPCTGAAVSAGTLTAAQYAQSFTYDVMGRMATGPAGSYAYADPAHLHAATSAGTGYTATYDAAGNMTCRAPTGASTCAGGAPTGAQLAYDNEGRLASWQSSPTAPSSTDGFLYDGQGQRVAQQVTQGGVTTTTVYIGGLEQVGTSGSSTTTTTYYYAGGRRIAMAVDGALTYLAADVLGSPDLAVSPSGSVAASQLFAPYGALRYASGTMASVYGFTGQAADPATGLDYYGARYYDPAIGQFTSADSVVAGGGFDPWGLSRYAYTEGNPTSRTDPTGHEPRPGFRFPSIPSNSDSPVGQILNQAASFGRGTITGDQFVQNVLDLNASNGQISQAQGVLQGLSDSIRSGGNFMSDALQKALDKNDQAVQLLDQVKQQQSQKNEQEQQQQEQEQQQQDEQQQQQQDQNQDGQTDQQQSDQPGDTGVASDAGTASDGSASDFSIGSDFNGDGANVNSGSNVSSGSDFSGGGLDTGGSFDTGGGSFDTSGGSFDFGGGSFDTGGGSFDFGGGSFDFGGGSFDFGGGGDFGF
jgi:RHS repeat-associated protein